MRRFALLSALTFLLLTQLQFVMGTDYMEGDYSQPENDYEFYNLPSNDHAQSAFSDCIFTRPDLAQNLDSNEINVEIPLQKLGDLTLAYTLDYPVQTYKWTLEDVFISPPHLTWIQNRFFQLKLDYVSKQYNTTGHINCADDGDYAVGLDSTPFMDPMIRCHLQEDFYQNHKSIKKTIADQRAIYEDHQSYIHSLRSQVEDLRKEITDSTNSSDYEVQRDKYKQTIFDNSTTYQSQFKEEFNIEETDFSQIIDEQIDDLVPPATRVLVMAQESHEVDTKEAADTIGELPNMIADNLSDLDNEAGDTTVGQKLSELKFRQPKDSSQSIKVPIKSIVNNLKEDAAKTQDPELLKEYQDKFDEEVPKTLAEAQDRLDQLEDEVFTTIESVADGLQDDVNSQANNAFKTIDSFGYLLKMEDAEMDLVRELYSGSLNKVDKDAIIKDVQDKLSTLTTKEITIPKELLNKGYTYKFKASGYNNDYFEVSQNYFYQIVDDTASSAPMRHLYQLNMNDLKFPAKQYIYPGGTNFTINLQKFVKKGDIKQIDVEFGPLFMLHNTDTCYEQYGKVQKWTIKDFTNSMITFQIPDQFEDQIFYYQFNFYLNDRTDILYAIDYIYAEANIQLKAQEVLDGASLENLQDIAKTNMLITYIRQPNQDKTIYLNQNPLGQIKKIIDLTKETSIFDKVNMGASAQAAYDSCSKYGSLYAAIKSRISIIQNAQRLSQMAQENMPGMDMKGQLNLGAAQGCKNSCSDHGTCESYDRKGMTVSKCQCDAGYVSEDCSMDKATQQKQKADNLLILKSLNDTKVSNCIDRTKVYSTLENLAQSGAIDTESANKLMDVMNSKLADKESICGKDNVKQLTSVVSNMIKQNMQSDNAEDKKAVRQAMKNMYKAMGSYMKANGVKELELDETNIKGKLVLFSKSDVVVNVVLSQTISNADGSDTLPNPKLSFDASALSNPASVVRVVLQQCIDSDVTCDASPVLEVTLQDADGLDIEAVKLLSGKFFTISIPIYNKQLTKANIQFVWSNPKTGELSESGCVVQDVVDQMAIADCVHLTEFTVKEVSIEDTQPGAQTDQSQLLLTWIALFIVVVSLF